MTKEEADTEAKKIFHEMNMKCDEAMEKARVDGTLKQGLDGNKELFEPIHSEAKERLDKLAAMVKEDK